jgi:hypothetical protein
MNRQRHTPTPYREDAADPVADRVDLSAAGLDDLRRSAE